MRNTWQYKKWEEVLEIRNGKGPKEAEVTNGKYPIIGSAGKPMGFSNNYICEEGTTIIGRKGTINNPIFVKTKFWNVDTAFGLHAFDSLDKRFLFYFCLNFDFTKMDRGSGRPSLVKSDLLQIKIPIPPLSEQKQIVALLDKAFAAIDKAQANIEKNIKNARELFQSKLDEVFSDFNKPDLINYKERKLNDLGVIGTGTTPSTKDKSNFGNFIPFIKPAHIKSDGSFKYGESMLSEKGLQKGRLFSKNSVFMVCIGATIGKTGFSSIPFSANQQINVLTPEKEYFSKFIYYAMISNHFQKQVLEAGRGAQATLPIINKSKWSNLKIKIPTDIVSQKNIATKLDKLKQESNKIQDVYFQKIDYLEQLKKSLLEKAFKGELTQKDTEAIEALDIAAEGEVSYQTQS